MIDFRSSYAHTLARVLKSLGEGTTPDAFLAALRERGYAKLAGRVTAEDFARLSARVFGKPTPRHEHPGVGNARRKSGKDLLVILKSCSPETTYPGLVNVLKHRGYDELAAALDEEEFARLKLSAFGTRAERQAAADQRRRARSADSPPLAPTPTEEPVTHTYGSTQQLPVLVREGDDDPPLTESEVVDVERIRREARQGSDFTWGHVEAVYKFAEAVKLVGGLAKARAMLEKLEHMADILGDLKK